MSFGICFSFFHISTASAGLRLLTNGSLAQGALDPKSFHERTLYEAVQNDFEKASAIKQAQISGLYSGRCFYSDSPNRPFASLLVVAESPNSKAVGPAFRAKGFKTILPLVDLKAAPDTFDALSGSSLRNLRKSAILRWPENSSAVETPRSLIIDGLRTFKTEARTYELRRSSEFIYLRLVCAEPGFCLNDRDDGTGYKILNNEGESTTACYYFKRLSAH